MRIEKPPPWKLSPGASSGSRPSQLSVTHGATCSCMKGTSTKRPHMPKMMLGIAASISTAVPTTRATRGGTSSVSSRAMTRASGTAMTIATRVVSAVPASAASAP